MSNASDTTKPEYKEYKMTESGFMAEYGKDDSSRALINYYFRQRAKAFRLTIIPIPATAIAITIVAIANPPATGTALILAFGLFTAAAVIVTLIGAYKLARHSRKRLLRMLEKYNKGESIPTNYSTSHYFKKYLQK